jgi:hypothetical protein
VITRKKEEVPVISLYSRDAAARVGHQLPLV